MANLTYKKLLSASDSDITALESAYRAPDTARFLSISDSYFNYVTTTDNVHFYKVYMSDTLVGALQLEIEGEVLFMSVLVFPEQQGRGIGTKIVSDVCNDNFGLGFAKIEISVDRCNIASLKMFESFGFMPLGEENELINFVYQKENCKQK